MYIQVCTYMFISMYHAYCILYTWLSPWILLLSPMVAVPLLCSRRTWKNHWSSSNRSVTWGLGESYMWMWSTFMGKTYTSVARIGILMWETNWEVYRSTILVVQKFFFPRNYQNVGKRSGENVMIPPSQGNWGPVMEINPPPNLGFFRSKMVSGEPKTHGF